MLIKTVLTAVLVGGAIISAPKTASAEGSKIIATYYRNGQILLDDHNAEFEVISNSLGNPSLGDTVRVIRWSDGTITNISQIRGETFMGGHPARSYGVGYIGGRVYEAYCTENVVDEMVCYKFLWLHTLKESDRPIRACLGHYRQALLVHNYHKENDRFFESASAIAKNFGDRTGLVSSLS